MALSHQTIPLSSTGLFSKLFTDYLNSSEKLNQFVAYENSLEGFKKAIVSREKFEVNRSILYNTIIQQYQKNKLLSDKIKSTVELLKDENTFTVCTGHQLCLFTGPLYFIYKIVTTINLAKQLKQAFPDKNFIPLYWMASEDHDFAEINYLYVFGKKVEWTKSEHSGEEAVGTLSKKGLDEVLSALSLFWGTTDKAEELKKLFEKSYLHCSNLAEATRFLVNELFKETDLLILDPNDSNLKTLFIKYMQQDILEHVAFTKVNESIGNLKALGYKVQVYPRQINLFYFDYQNRKRIVENSDGTFQLYNSEKKFTKVELLNELNSNPQKFSPNVTLRPLYQQVILPNLAYVGGPGELAYWLEYKLFFEAQNIFFPVLTPRSFACVIDGRTQQLMEKTAINENLLFASEEAKIKYFIQHLTELPDTGKVKSEIEKAFSVLINEAEKTDVTLKPFVESELQKVLKSVDTIKHKLERAQKQKNENAINQIKKLHEKIFPNGTLQERYDNFSSIYLSEGEGFLHYLLNTFDAFTKDMYLLKLNSN
ncbi:MAG: bacillithiol biosynthesis cysteine-adding enzyme BshC [Bacteroidia bacterium]